jgi:hypothetical protein
MWKGRKPKFHTVQPKGVLYSTSFCKKKGLFTSSNQRQCWLKGGLDPSLLTVPIFKNSCHLLSKVVLESSSRCSVCDTICDYLWYLKHRAHTFWGVVGVNDTTSRHATPCYSHLTPAALIQLQNNTPFRIVSSLLCFCLPKRKCTPCINSISTRPVWDFLCDPADKRKFVLLMSSFALKRNNITFAFKFTLQF